MARRVKLERTLYDCSLTCLSNRYDMSLIRSELRWICPLHESSGLQRERLCPHGYESKFEEILKTDPRFILMQIRLRVVLLATRNGSRLGINNFYHAECDFTEVSQMLQDFLATAPRLLTLRNCRAERADVNIPLTCSFSNRPSLSGSALRVTGG